jgi:hypothetical protein
LALMFEPLAKMFAWSTINSPSTRFWIIVQLVITATAP